VVNPTKHFFSDALPMDNSSKYEDMET
jgi:hypothetical protein